MAQLRRELIGMTSTALSAKVDPQGAQLMSLRTAAGTELLWQGDPAIWPDRAPILFPVIGPMTNGQIRHAGKTWPVPPHGFARMSDFAIVELASNRSVFELRDSVQSHAHYPFAFVLQVMFELSGHALLTTISVTNTGSEAMPADLGFHPGFNWPLRHGEAREDYAIIFPVREPAPIRRGVDDPIFLLPNPQATPVDGNVLRMRDALFDGGPVVFDQLTSRSLMYGPSQVTGNTRLRIDFPDSPYLGVWSRPGAGFVAIEPWQGLPSPAGFEGPLSEKPGISIIEPGVTRQWRLSITWIDSLEEG